MRVKRAVFLSLALHLLLAIALYILISVPISAPKIVPEIAVEMISSEPRAAGAESCHRQSHRKGGAKLPSFESLKLSDIALPPKSSGGKETESGWSQDDWGSGGGDARHIESTSDLQLLAGELDGAMSYPDSLVARGIAATISVRLFFQNAGGCDWRNTKILPGEPHLRIYVLGLLKKVCALGQIQKLHLHTSDYADVSFNFHLLNTDSEIQSVAPWITGNVIGLERQRQHSAIKIPLGPIVLFDGDLAHVDFGWLFEQWDRLVGEKKDPMAAFQ